MVWQDGLLLRPFQDDGADPHGSGCSPQHLRTCAIREVPTHEGNRVVIPPSPGEDICPGTARKGVVEHDGPLPCSDSGMAEMPVRHQNKDVLDASGASYGDGH